MKWVDAVKNKVGNFFKDSKKVIDSSEFEVDHIGRPGFSQAKDDDSPFAKAVKKIGYILNITSRSDSFSGAEFDLQQIEDAYNTDSYIKQALDKYNELMFKAGWSVVSSNESVTEYLEKRFDMLSIGMGQPMEQFLREISDDLVKFSNVFIIKARSKPEDMYGINGVNVKGLGKKDPVSAYFRVAPQTMEIKVDKNGTIKKYRQTVDGEEKEFNPEDVIHISYKKPAGRFFGIPMILPALEDVKLLREIEDNIGRLIYRHLYPLFVYKIGLDKPGWEATDEEIETMQQEIRDMPTEGGIVIPERHDIDMLKPEPLDAEQYLEYYENRVFTGLGMSRTLMGRGNTASRSTAENQSSELRDKVRAFQKAMQDAINYYIIRELLMEGGFDPIANKDHQGSFVFNEIDIDLKIKKENQVIYKFEHNAITHEEMREGLGEDPVKDESRLLGNMFGDVDTSSIDNKNNPQNQHSSDEQLDKEIDLKSFEYFVGNEHYNLKQNIVEAVDDYKTGCIKESNLKDIIANEISSFNRKTKIYAKRKIYDAAQQSIEKISEKSKKINKISINSCKSLVGQLQLESNDLIFTKSNKLAESLEVLIEKDQLNMSLINSNLSSHQESLHKNIRKILSKSFNLGIYKSVAENDVSKEEFFDKDLMQISENSILNELPSETFVLNDVV